MDPDLTALARAQAEARRRGLALQLDRGYADELPYADDSVDVVLSSFMLLHVPAEPEGPAMQEVRRVLRPGGALHLVDIDATAASAGGWIARRAHQHELVEENSGGTSRPAPAAGFLDVRETGSMPAATSAGSPSTGQASERSIATSRGAGDRRLR